MIASQIIVWFYFFGLLGWVFESVYCSLVEGHWCNRGFLYGPICPIYGMGGVCAIAIFNNPLVSGSLPPAWVIFLICGIGASAIEWFTSIAMERMFGTVWWDYSNLPLNIKGRVCAPAACLFGVCGLAIVHLVLPLVRMVVAAVPPLAFEILGLVLTALLTADTMLTVATLTEVVAMVEQAEAEVNERVQGAVDAGSASIRSGAEKIREGGERLRDTGAGAAEKLRDGRDAAATRLREGGAEAAERLRGAGTEATGRLRDGRDAASMRLRDLSAHMSARQQHVLLNARRFRTEGLGRMARRIDAAVQSQIKSHNEENNR